MGSRKGEVVTQRLENKVAVITGAASGLGEAMARLFRLTGDRQFLDGAKRSLLCSLCSGEWEFRRIVCAGCGQEDKDKLPVYTADQFPHMRVECCDACHTYIKSVDLTKNGLADPLVDELASVPLDLWAQEHGYAKLHPNLLGL